MKEKIFNIVLALCLLALGVILIGDVVKVWDMAKFFKGWWTILIMVPSLMGIILKSSKLSYTYILCLGVVLLLACQKVLGVNQSFVVMFGILAILLAVEIIIMIFFKNKKKNLTSVNASLYTGIFGSIEEKYNSVNFDGCKVLSTCGSVELDLSNAKIKKDTVITVTCVLGSVNLTVPKSVEVKISGRTILGETVNNKSKSSKPTATLHIESTCVLGAIEIR